MTDILYATVMKMKLISFHEQQQQAIGMVDSITALSFTGHSLIHDRKTYTHYNYCHAHFSNELKMFYIRNRKVFGFTGFNL